MSPPPQNQIGDELPPVTVEPQPVEAAPKKATKKPRSTARKATAKAAAAKKPAPPAQAPGAAAPSDGSGEVQGATADAVGLNPNGKYTAGGVALGETVSDTGTTVYDATNVNTRTLGGGDANSFARNAANTQYQNDTSEDAGTNPYREIDTKPMVFSISGGKTYQNNIIMNGVSINNVVNPIENSDAKLDDDAYPVLDIVYGVHPQTVYVPQEFVEKATIIDSNASAKYGEFQGGVVKFDLTSPPTDRWRSTFSYLRNTDDMINWKLGTDDGTNPLDRRPPEFTKNNVAVSLGGPVSSALSVLAQYSGKYAKTKQQKDYEFYNQIVGMESENHFFRVAALARTEIGSFKLETSRTDYVQTWESEAFRNLFINVESFGQSTQLEHKSRLSGFVAPSIGLGNVNVTSRAFYNKSETANVSTGDTAWAWVGMQRRKGRTDPPSAWTTIFDATLTDSYCRELPVEALGLTSTQDNTACREGGWGSLYSGQTDFGANTEFTGSLLWGRFLLGGEAKRVKGTRERPRDFTYYTSFNTLATSPTVTSFTCPPGDEACTFEQYARIWTTSPAFDIEAAVSSVNMFAELDQTFGWFNIRAGVRFDYEDYFENPNFAPRLVASLTPLSWFSITGGYNRYYDGATLIYAIRDAQPRAITNTRSTHDAAGNVSDTWTSRTNTGFSYRSSGLDTPYKDEYTAAVRVKEPIFGGHFRLRYLERYGRDEFSRDNCPETSSSLCNLLTNNGESTYKSWTLEYAGIWINRNPWLLSAVGLNMNVTWSEQSTHRGTYFDGDGSEEYILYNGQRYTQENFVAVTGNLDIPVRIGATLSTRWYKDALKLGLHANYNLGYKGVYDTGVNQIIEGLTYNVFADRDFSDALRLDLFGLYDFNQYSALEFKINNLTDSKGNSVATYQNPWLRGRTFWIGTKLKL